VDFRNTVLIMTSNLGSDLISRSADGFGFTARNGQQASPQADQLMRRLRESFRPEFLNRIDEVIIFRQLSREQLRQVTELLLEHTRRKLHAQGVTMDLRPEAVDWLAGHGYQPEFGARPMRRTIQREVDNQLSRMLLDGLILPGQRVSVGAGDGRLTFEVREGEPASH
jgi:ATP-dependent Clp protease ATP-binding subunit ClpC